MVKRIRTFHRHVKYKSGTWDWIDLNNEPIGAIRIIIKIMIGCKIGTSQISIRFRKPSSSADTRRPRRQKKFRRWEREPLFRNLTLRKSLGMLKQTVRKSISDWGKTGQKRQPVSVFVVTALTGKEERFSKVTRFFQLLENEIGYIPPGYFTRLDTGHFDESPIFSRSGTVG